MIRGSTVLLALLLSSACDTGTRATESNGAETSQPSATTPDEKPSGQPVMKAAEIRGEWRVAGVAGKPVDQPEGITASILSQEIHAVAGCVRWNWGFTIDSGMLRMERRLTAVPPCARGLTKAEADLENAMGAARFAVRRPDGSLILADPAGEVVLFTQ